MIIKLAILLILSTIISNKEITSYLTKSESNTLSKGKYKKMNWENNHITGLLQFYCSLPPSAESECWSLASEMEKLQANGSVKRSCVCNLFSLEEEANFLSSLYRSILRKPSANMIQKHCPLLFCLFSKVSWFLRWLMAQSAAF